MKNAIRCCISCILPCGALDVIRIVHSNGKVEEITGNHVRAADIIKAYPNHVLKKPNSSPSDTNIDVCGIHPKIVIVPPAAQLQRGKIYFLIPVPAAVSEKTTARRKQKKKEISQSNSTTTGTPCDDTSTADRYLTDITSEKLLSVKRRGRAGVWRPRLESITETASEVC